MYNLILKPKARKEFNRLEFLYQKKVTEILNELVREPFSGKKLSGIFKNEYSVYAWPYRIVYEIHKKDMSIVVIRIRHRQSVYRT